MYRSIIARNVTEVHQRIAEAARRSGRQPDDIELVAVTKYVDIEITRAVAQAGCPLLGESRPQQLCQKAETMQGEPVQWHLIGALQRNKIRRTLSWVDLIHSTDRLKQIEAIDRIAGELDRRIPLLLEVNISGDAAKGGFSPEEIDKHLEELACLKNIAIRGLMGMAGLEGNQETARRNFSSLRELRNRLRRNCPEEIILDDLSMGMSRDYEVAIEEGATLVRVGSALYEGIDR